MEIILNVAERCNINCSYCYFFNGADQTYRANPPVISDRTARATATFLREGCQDLRIGKLQIDLHGGEPLMMGKGRFGALCSLFRSELEPVTDLRLCVQTNAMLVDDEWVSVFERHRVRVGTSLDGPREYHDEARVDFRGNGTYERTVEGIRVLQAAADRRRLDSFGVLCVINPQHSARTIYRHFVDDLGFRTMDFLLPDVTHDRFHDQRAEAYGTFLCELFDEWSGDDDPTIQVRILNSVLSLLLGGSSRLNGFGLELAPALTISSAGEVGPDDLLRACGPEMMRTGANVANASLSGLLEGPFIRWLEEAHQDLADVCRECCWLRVCGGGLLVNRHRKDNGFRNPSVLCAGLKMFYAHVAAALVKKGLPIDALLGTMLGSAIGLGGISTMSNSPRVGAGTSR